MAFLALVAELRTLKGGAKVTYPEGDKDYPTTERVLRLKRGDHLPTFGDPEPDATRFPNNKLSQQVETGGDVQWVEVYRKYERLPGKIVTTTRLDDDGNVVTVSRQRKVVGEIVSGESFADTPVLPDPPDGTGNWSRQYKGEGDTYAAVQVTESVTIPGVLVGSEKYENDSNTVINRTQQLKRKTFINVQAILSMVGPLSVVTEMEEVGSGLVAHEVVTLIPQATAHNDASAIVVGGKTIDKQFPATLDVSLYSSSGGLLGWTRPHTRTVYVTRKAYWTVADAPPTEEELNIDGVPLLADVQNLLGNGNPLREVVMNPTTLTYPDGTALVYTGSVPTLADYLSDWVGEAGGASGDDISPRCIEATVTQAGNLKRWRVEKWFIANFWILKPWTISTPP